MKIIVEKLFGLQDLSYKEFHSKLIPEVDAKKVIGVRTPVLRKFAKEIAKENYVEDFLEELPHSYYEENNLHGELLILRYKDLNVLLEKLEQFLPYIDNWATCDLLSPKIFKKNLPLVYEYVLKWIKSEHTFTVRFGVVTLLGFFLDEEFKEEHLRLLSEIKTEEYYIKMAIAWYYSIALVKHYEETLPYLQNSVLDKWTHNKAIQKAIESLRINQEQKDYLRGLKIK